MNYYNEIKTKLIDNEIYFKVKDYSKERHKVITYFEIGKILIEAQGGEERAKYGDSLIKEYAQRLTNELGKGYNTTALKRMRKFFVIIQKGATMSHQLTWSHYVELLKINDINIINYYIDISTKYCINIRELREKIKSKEYERLPNYAKNKLINKKRSKVRDLVRNPIIIRNNNNLRITSERLLHQLILENIESFIKELGNSFCFVGSEYPIKLGNRYNYIDLLLFNIEYNCYVVVELKVTELKKEHIGQIQIYMNYIDESLRKINQHKTIGIIICKQDNKYVIKYCSDKRIIARTYELI